MMMRVSLAQVPVWQIAASIVLLIASCALVVWLSAWIFRVGLLMTGKRLNVKTLFQVIRQGNDQVITIQEQSSIGEG
jgi:ABC-2 type transport system permease protein